MQHPLFGFTISCTTQTVYQVRYTSGQLCYCGEYFVKNQTLAQVCDANLVGLNFTVEISVEKFRSQREENCSFIFFFFSAASNIRFDLKILPGNISTTVQSSLTASKVLPTSTTTIELPEGTFDVYDLFSECDTPQYFVSDVLLSCVFITLMFWLNENWRELTSENSY